MATQVYDITEKAGAYLAGIKLLPGQTQILLTPEQAAYELAQGTITPTGQVIPGPAEPAPVLASDEVTLLRDGKATRPTAAALADFVRRQANTAPRRLIIGSHGGQITNATAKGGGDTTAQHLSRVLFATGAHPVADIRAHYYWGYLAGGGAGEGTLGNGGTVQAAFEGNGHPGRRMTFSGGQSSIAAADNALFETDSLPEGIVGPYATGFIRTLVDVTAGQFYPLATYNGTTTAAVKAASGLTAGLLSSGVPAGTLDAGQFGPIAVTGNVLGPAVAVAALGCSIEDGTGDTKDAAGIYQPIGYLFRGLTFDADGATASAPVPHAKLTRGSETLASLIEVNTGRARLSICRYATDVVIGCLASNDFAASTALATVQANLRRLALTFKAMGCRVWAVNIPPRCTGSFSAGAPLPAASQSYYNAKFGPGADADLFNQWLLTQVGDCLDDVFDLYAIMADPAAAWKLRSDIVCSADGTHPVQAIHILAGQAFSTWARARFTA
jgi:hypothetical protein